MKMNDDPYLKNISTDFTVLSKSSEDVIDSESPLAHNIGTLHSNTEAVEPSFVSIANAGTTVSQVERSSIRKVGKEMTNSSIENSAKGSGHNIAAKSYGGGLKGNPNSHSPNKQQGISSGSTQRLPSLNYPISNGDNVKDWHQILISIGKVRGEAVVKLAGLIMTRKYAENPLRATALASELLENASDEFCENITTLLSDGWDQSIGALISCARSL